MGHSHVAGTTEEFDSKLSIRWSAGGGDSNSRFRSAVRSLADWHRIIRRCTFSTDDAFAFLKRCEDKVGHGIYADPPFPKVGRKYRHHAGPTDDDERAWHVRLRDAVARFEKARVVMRFHDHAFVRELYRDSKWMWVPLVGRTQANTEAAELLVINGQPRTVNARCKSEGVVHSVSSPSRQNETGCAVE